MAEKQRRDNLNTQIATMASLVPTVSNGGSRKKDKISVLRLTAAHLRVAYTLGVPSNNFLPRQFNDIDLENCLIDNLAGSTSFLLVVTTTGKIIYISRHVEQHLGHEQIDLIGDSLYNYTYEKDHEELTRGLAPDESCMVGKSIAGASDSLEDSSNSSDESVVRPEYSNFKTQRRSFNIRMTQRTNSRRETPQYEYVLVSGVLRLANECRVKERPKLAENTSTSNDIIFVGTGRLLKKRSITELSVLEANKNEYFTRHLPDGRIIFCDHRISIIAGYMSDEVSGTSAFKFMHREDVRWTIVALREMYRGGTNYGSSCYRLMTKTGDYIYLRTHGYLEYDESANCVTSFVCINTLTTEEEGAALITEMKKRFSAITNKSAIKIIQGDGFESECSIASHLVDNMDDSSQLEDAVAHLLDDLPQPIIEDRDSPAPLPNSQLVKAAIYSQGLPPASIQANKVGIKDISNAYASLGKGGKGDKNGKGKRNAAGKKDIDNGENKNSPNNSKDVKMHGEKKMPELDDPSSPVAVTTSQALVPFEERVFPPVNEVDDWDPDLRVVATLKLPPIPKSETNLSPNFASPFELKELYNEGPSIKANDDLQLSLPQQKPRQQTGLKRPYEPYDLQNTNNISPKKRSGNNGVNGVIISDSKPCANEDYSAAYVPVQPITLSEMQKVQSEFKQPEANELSMALTDDQYLNFQDIQSDQLLNSAIENNPDIIKLFSNIPPTINLNETEVEDQNSHQYPTSDQGIVVENEVRRAHLLLADSMSSCESQYSDPEDSAIAHEHNDHKIQKQQHAGLQLNV